MSREAMIAVVMALAIGWFIGYKEGATDGIEDEMKLMNMFCSALVTHMTQQKNKTREKLKPYGFSEEQIVGVMSGFDACISMTVEAWDAVSGEDDHDL